MPELIGCVKLVNGLFAAARFNEVQVASHICLIDPTFTLDIGPFRCGLLLPSTAMATLAPRLNAVEAREIIEAKKIQIRQLHKKVRKRIDQNVRLEEEISALERDREDIVRASTHENESQAPYVYYDPEHPYFFCMRS